MFTCRRLIDADLNLVSARYPNSSLRGLQTSQTHSVAASHQFPQGSADTLAEFVTCRLSTQTYGKTLKLKVCWIGRKGSGPAETRVVRLAPCLSEGLLRLQPSMRLGAGTSPKSSGWDLLKTFPYHYRRVILCSTLSESEQHTQEVNRLQAHEQHLQRASERRDVSSPLP